MQTIWLSSTQLFTATLLEMMAKVALVSPAEAPVSLPLFQYNGLFPSPHPSQLLALSPSLPLVLRQAAADRTVQARGQLVKRGRDSWTCCQLHWLTRNHTHIKASWWTLM